MAGLAGLLGGYGSDDDDEQQQGALMLSCSVMLHELYQACFITQQSAVHIGFQPLNTFVRMPGIPSRRHSQQINTSI